MNATSFVPGESPRTGLAEKRYMTSLRPHFAGLWEMVHPWWIVAIAISLYGVSISRRGAMRTSVSTGNRAVTVRIAKTTQV